MVIFIPVTEVTLRCPRCKHQLDHRPFYGVCSRLGPRAVICPKCEQGVMTDRLEWVEMAWPERAWYVVVSLIYAAVLASFGAMSVWCVLYFAFDAFKKKIPEALAGAWPGMLLCGGGAVVIQAYRVSSSLARSREGGSPRPIRLTWRSPDLGLQGKAASVLVITPILACLLSLPLRWLGIGGWRP